jgi:tetrapyrrole methylase family protein/MazG family protein
VFADVEAGTPDEVYANWERIKADEKGDERIDAEMPSALPALVASQKIQRRAAGRGFDWSQLSGAVEKVREELGELEEAARGQEGRDPEGEGKDALEEEVGDVLFAVSALARKLGVDAESALRGTMRKFVARFEAMDEKARSEGLRLDDLTEEDLLRRFREAR